MFAKLSTVALAALALCACVEVKQPIGAAHGYANDPALEGFWRSDPADDKPSSYVHVILNDDNSMTVVGVAPRHGKDRASWGVLTLTTAALGPNRYMNVREVSEDGKPKDPHDASFPLLYTLKGDTLALFDFGEKPVAAAIRAHRIEGTIEKHNFGDTVAITADAAHLDAAMARPDAPGLFEPLMTLHRAK